MVESRKIGVGMHRVLPGGSERTDLKIIWTVFILLSHVASCNGARHLLHGLDEDHTYPRHTELMPAAVAASTSQLKGEFLSLPTNYAAPAPQGAASDAPLTSPDAPPSEPQTCPEVTLRLTSIEIYDAVIRRPNSQIAVQCRTKDSDVPFAPVAFSSVSDVVRSATGARYRLEAPVAKLTCGQTVTCTVAYSDGWAPDTWTSLADGGCWFDYRHFTQLSYEEPLSAWTCTKPPVRYTLECVECSDPEFPWEAALELGGPPLSEASMGGATTALNSVMVIISVSVVAGAVMVVIAAVVLRSRRRASAAAEEAQRAEALRARMASRSGQRRRRGTVKPPQMFVVGDPDGPPPPEGYRGPIVVLHCGEGEEEEAFDAESSGGSSTDKDSEILKWPRLAIAQPDVPEGEEERERAERRRRRKAAREAGREGNVAAVNNDDESNNNDISSYRNSNNTTMTDNSSSPDSTGMNVRGRSRTLSSRPVPHQDLEARTSSSGSSRGGSIINGGN